MTDIIKAAADRGLITEKSMVQLDSKDHTICSVCNGTGVEHHLPCSECNGDCVIKIKMKETS